MNLAGAVILDGGHAKSQEHLRIAEIINEYDPELELAWIPPEQRNFDDTQPFAVIHRPAGREPYVVFRLREDEVDHRVLSRLFAGDNGRQNVLASVEADEAALQLVNLKRQLDAEAHANEMAAWALKAKAGSTLKPGVRLE